MDHPADILRPRSSNHSLASVTPLDDFFLQHLLNHPLNLRHERLWVEERNLAAVKRMYASWNRGDPGFIDYFGRPWALNWEEHFEKGWEKPKN